MLLNVEMSVEILHADVVDVEVVTSRDRANAVEDILRTLRARKRLNSYVSVVEDLLNCGSYSFHQLL